MQAAPIATPSLPGSAVYLLLGIAIIFVGLAALAISIMRRARYPILLSFAALAVLYGGRLLLIERGWASVLFGIGPNARDYWLAGITYVIPIPALIFWDQLLEGTRRRLLRRWLVVQVVFAVGALAVLPIFGPTQLAYTVNNVLVIILTVLLIRVIVGGVLQQPRSDVRILSAGLLIFAATVLFDNVAGSLYEFLGAKGRVEPFGFVVFLACLGYVAAERIFADEAKLIAVRRELDIARDIQLRILPQRIPNVPGIRVAVAYSPMTEVAGDFYDFVEIAEGFGIFVADVAGHGVPAALIASMLKVAIGAAPDATNPAALLRHVNEILCRAAAGHLTTAAYLFIERRGHAYYSAAGHCPMLVCRNGQIEAVQENGLIMGIRPGEIYRNRELDVTMGDRFVLLTDGVLEAEDRSGENFGDRRLTELLHEKRNDDAETVASAISAAAKSWAAGQAQQDDMTLLVIDV